jgi:hypothetical protein
MKHLLIIFISVFITNIQSDNENFQVENGSLVWQKVYQTDLSQEELIKQIKTSGKFDEIKSFEDNLSASISRNKLDFKELGESNSSVPIYIASSDISGFILFEFKEKKYRVTVKNIKLVQQYKDALSEEGELTNIEDFALKNKNSEFRSSFLKKPAQILDYTFTKLTKIEKKSTNDEW